MKQEGATHAAPCDELPPGCSGVERVCSAFGCSRGKPIDRRYIEAFLQRHRKDIRGRVLEVGEVRYAEAFDDGQVERCDVLHKPPGGRKATVVLDLCGTAEGPGNAFDCIICTQTLDFVQDPRRAMRHLVHMVKPGGVLLVTSGCIGPISRFDMERWGHYWRFTPAGLGAVVQEAGSACEVEAFGNSAAASAFLYGLAEHEVAREHFDSEDLRFPVTAACRVVKGDEGRRASSRGGRLGGDGRSAAAMIRGTGELDAVEMRFWQMFLDWAGVRADDVRPSATHVAGAADGARRIAMPSGIERQLRPERWVGQIWQALPAGGVLLLGAAGIRRSAVHAGAAGDYWRFTDIGIRCLLERWFGARAVSVHFWGNAATVVQSLWGEDVRHHDEGELSAHDRDVQQFITAKAVKGKMA